MPDDRPRSTDYRRSITGGPWTRHGHSVPGITIAGNRRPSNTAKCGGPSMCRQCEEDAAGLIATFGTAADEQEAIDPGVDACPHLGQCPTCSPGNYLCASTVRTETTPDEEVRRHPLHAVLTAALRSGMAPCQPAVARIWGRRSLDLGGTCIGAEGNVWAGSPEDVADHLVRAILDNLPTIDGRWAITPTLEHLDDPPPTLTTTPPSSVLHDGDRISVADADGKGVNGYVAGWTTAPGGHPFVILCTMDEPGFPPPPRRHAPLCGALRGQDCTCSEAGQ